MKEKFVKNVIFFFFIGIVGLFVLNYLGTIKFEMVGIPWQKVSLIQTNTASAHSGSTQLIATFICPQSDGTWEKCLVEKTRECWCIGVQGMTGFWSCNGRVPNPIDSGSTVNIAYESCNDAGTLSIYKATQYYCGNGRCDSEINENCAVCSKDCGICPTTTTTTTTTTTPNCLGVDCGIVFIIGILATIGIGFYFIKKHK